MKGIPFVAVLGVALVSAAGGSASAREFAVNGSIHYKVEPTGQVNLAAGRTLVSQRLVGTIKVDDESAPINDSSQECVGAFVIQDGQTIEGHGYCVAHDAGGDTWWLSYAAGPTESAWMVTGGTGKYAGMTGGGNTFYASDAKSITAADGWMQKISGTLNMGTLNVRN